MDIKEEEEIKKEFQLERVVLFSDAVFAIIITIMVIEIKLPEGLRHQSHEKVREAFIELLPKFAGYISAFFLVAVFWTKHLRIFSYLKDYTKQLIIFNLIFLFFISLFPFGVSLMTETISPKNFEGLFIYIGIVMLASMTQTLLIWYLIRNAKTLCIRPAEIERNLEWKAQRFNFIAIPVLLLYVAVITANHYGPNAYTVGFIIWAAVVSLVRKKFYPKQNTDGPMLARLFRSRKAKPADTE
ncbi:DUF1211 domain-containing protein [Mucilaginibacter sp. 14171R-50]|uniref:TMEM175 family protein n=1 Tax=Mucilaginibacter sp. 14171R-50 TaxID=2703789 RepID=UPI00138DB06C|nr:TMEM175 family protein [Mucilaginibacter sp. 14171R-50]QHS56781.1 DUF1211 domain-containing protein [Mucilaginibacter sp. 14171R-50]